MNFFLWKLSCNCHNCFSLKINKTRIDNFFSQQRKLKEHFQIDFQNKSCTSIDQDYTKSKIKEHSLTENCYKVISNSFILCENFRFDFVNELLIKKKT